jgi:DNA-directed RNA polymerase specialized sigma24 family protein
MVNATPSTLDILLRTLVSDPDSAARDRALAKLLRRVEIIARNLKGDDIQRDSGSILMSVIGDLAGGSGKNADGEPISFKNEASALAYFREAIRRKIIETREHEARRPVAVPMGEAPGHINPAGRVSDGEKKQRIEELEAARAKALAGLSGRDRKVVELRTSSAEKLEWEAIAGRVGLASDHCRQIYSRFGVRVKAEMKKRFTLR